MSLLALEAAERELVTRRLLEPVPASEFDLDHLKVIHRHLFQDVCAWAGEIRTVESAKDGGRFQPSRFIETGIGGHLPPHHGGGVFPGIGAERVRR